VSAATPELGFSDGRLLTFEVLETVYALPISQVLEVTERGRTTCVPKLERSCAGVMNWHGEALPVLSPILLLLPDEQATVSGEKSDLEREHVLVISDRPDGAARMGLPIDRVLGLVSAEATRGAKGELVIERRSIDGRVVSVLDPRRLVSRGAEVIQRAVA